MRIVALADVSTVRRVYAELLVPSFPADEMVPLTDIEAIASAGGLMWAARDDAGEIAGVAVGEWDDELRVLLLSWLVVRDGRRGGGVGGPLLDTVVAHWRERFDPCLVLAEVEDPAHHDASAAYGDPVARLRFYHRHGARALDMPYLQPALSPRQSRVPGMFLIVLHADPSFAGTAADTIDAHVLRRYLERYQIDCEGRIATDPDADRMWQALDRPDGVPLRSLG